MAAGQGWDRSGALPLRRGRSSTIGGATTHSPRPTISAPFFPALHDVTPNRATFPRPASPAPKARPIPAWGSAPGGATRQKTRAEGPAHPCRVKSQPPIPRAPKSARPSALCATMASDSLAAGQGWDRAGALPLRLGRSSTIGGATTHPRRPAISAPFLPASHDVTPNRATISAPASPAPKARPIPAWGSAPGGFPFHKNQG